MLGSGREREGESGEREWRERGKSVEGEWRVEREERERGEIEREWRQRER